MLVGELHDLLTEKLRTREFSRLDTVVISDGVDDESVWTIDDLSKVDGNYVRVESSELNTDLEMLYVRAGSATWP
jgi:hypothetical protein